MTIVEIQQKIASFQVVPCQLHHEIVQLDVNTQQPVKSGTIESPNYQRVSFCPKEIRKKRLGCAHSYANESFMETLNQLPKKDHVIEDLKTQMDEVICKIFVLDHQKGELEKDWAKALEAKNNDTIIQSELQQQIATCIEQHTQVMTQLSALKERVVDRLGELIVL